MALDDEVRDRVIFLGGQAVGADCPECQFRGRSVDLDPRSMGTVRCPDCGAVLLSPDQKDQLRKAGKL